MMAEWQRFSDVDVATAFADAAREWAEKQCLAANTDLSLSLSDQFVHCIDDAKVSSQADVFLALVHLIGGFLTQLDEVGKARFMVGLGICATNLAKFTEADRAVH